MRKKILSAVFWIGVFIVLYLISKLAGVPCVYLKYFHVICPGCGMTRAITAAIHLQFHDALRCHPMVFSLPALLAYIIADGHPFKNKYINMTILSLIGAGFLITYLVRFTIFMQTGDFIARGI